MLVGKKTTPKRGATYQIGDKKVETKTARVRIKADAIRMFVFIKVILAGLFLINKLK